MPVDNPQNARNAMSGETTPISARDSVTGDVVPNVGDAANDAIRVNVVAGGGGGGGGVQFPEGQVAAAGNLGTQALGVAAPGFKYEPIPIVTAGQLAAARTGDVLGLLAMGLTDPGVAVPLLTDLSGSLLPGTAAANIGKASGQTWTGADVGVMALGVDQNGTYTQMPVNSDYPSVPVGFVWPGTNADQLGKAQGAVAAAGDVGVAAMNVRGSDGTYAPPSLAAVGDGPSGGFLSHAPMGYDPNAGGFTFINLIDTNGLGAGSVVVYPDPLANWMTQVNNLAFNVQQDQFAAPGVGVVAPVSQGVNKFSLQVVPLGAVTSWTVVLEGTLDAVNWGTILTHTNLAPGASGIVSIATGPMRSLRSRCVSLVLGAGTGVGAIFGSTI